MVKRLNHKIDIDDYIDCTHEKDIRIEDGKVSHIYLFAAETHSVGLSPAEAGEEPGIEYVIANRFIRNMNMALDKNPGRPALIHMKTDGGNWDDGMAIYDTIKSYPSPTTIINYSRAASMSSVIFLAADKKVMMPDSHFMYHNVAHYAEGNYHELEHYVEFIKKSCEERLWQIYAGTLKKNGKFKKLSEPQIKEMLQENVRRKTDVFLTAEEAVEWGFADEIFDGNWGRLTEYTPAQRKRK